MNHEDQFALMIEMVYNACMHICDLGALDGNVKKSPLMLKRKGFIHVH